MSERIEPATLADGPAILALRRSAEDWLVARGITQWQPGWLTLADIEPEIIAGEWHLLRDGAELIGALRLLWSDERVWRDENAFAVYVHGLMINRKYQGQDVGVRLLRWAEEQGRAAGAPELRLDCLEDNPPLRQYYARQGFREVGRRDFGGHWYSAVLLTKPIAAAN